LRSTGICLGLAVVLVLAGCERDDPILPGIREDIRDQQTGPGFTPNEEASDVNDLPLVLPKAVVNAEWTQSIGSELTRNAHPALSKTPRLIWSASIGTGDGRKTRITADPVVALGQIYVMDAQSKVTALTTEGATVWSADLVPDNETGTEASGGGLAYGDGKIFVTSGFGLLTALDAQTGAVIWQQNMRATGTGSPAYMEGLVYAVSGDDVAWALDADTGRIQWQLSATPDLSNVLGGPTPVLSQKYVVFAYGAGEFQGAFRKGGLRLWDAQIAGQRPGFVSARVGDITGGPVIVGDRIFTGSHSGRTVALNIANGKRLWTAKDGPLNRVWPAGNSIFMVTDRNELVRINAENGRRIWGKTLSFFKSTRPKRQSRIIAHHGPIIAGGQLIVASDDGFIHFYDPVTGAEAGTVALPGGASSNPVVAGGTLYVVTSNGKLLAFR
jgi:outer membrane protein assembly factor BamB